MRVEFVDTNAMKSPEFNLHLLNIRFLLSLITLATVILVTTACDDREIPATVTIAASPETLDCDDCELVEVNEVIDANTVLTSKGEVQMYGAYILDQPADCAMQAENRLRSLAGEQIRIQSGPVDSVRRDEDHYYLFTEDGQSIDQKLIDEGLALTWDQDGQHLGWLLFKDAKAKEAESGCLWHDYQAFQRGEPNEFRIPGLTYRDS